MNQLYISLLRAGDFIMQVPLIRSNHKNGETHVVINDEFRQLENLYPEFHFHFFPRQLIQKTINDSSTSLLKPYIILQDFLHELEYINWNEIYNLSHTRISAYLMNELKAPKKKGLQHDGQSFIPFNNQWMRFLNDRFSENKRSPYHYLTVLSQALDLAVPPAQLKEKRDSADILFQCFTSDRKKNWPLEKWAELLQRLQKSRSELDVKVLCAPSELNDLKAFFPESNLKVASLTEARNLIKAARLLICGDTSMAHL
ncbi:MAG: glycosyltransferase family 9 protein, partial [Bdellovibrionales bacterium]